METRVCEFCKVYRAVVYCIADTANLCLTCDAKVHSANSLSGRHLRTVLCDSCKNQPCVVRCLDHKMFLCHVCNDKVHGSSSSSSSKHRRNGVSCYTGCPSAKDFAVMWGFRVMDDDNVSLEQSFRMVKPKRSEMNKVQRGGGLILEQILELEKVQLKEENGSSSLTEQADPSPLEKSEELSGKEMIVDFSQFSSSFTLGEFFWEGKIPYNKNNQMWHQNLQDIGVCEDPICNEDDFQIPDIDLTFRNFEEQFGSDPEPDSDSNNMFFVSSLDKSHKAQRKTFCSSKFDNSRFANKPASSSISFSSRETHIPHNHSEEVISFCSPLSNKVHQKAISRLKEKKRTRTEEKQT